jgi:lipopolysaccharide transport system ATP-binding protein
MIAGTLTPTTGQIQVNGRVAALLELGSGFNPEFTGRENVYLNASVLGLKESEIDAKLQTILDFADIGDFVDQPVKTYSSGMTMRLAFAVIANVNADILIVDEALAVGDVFFIQKCMRFIREFQEYLQ